jgi:Family of unknown function (DUF6491)
MKTIACFALAAFCSGLGSYATAADTTKKPNDNDCLFSTTVRDWRALDTRHLVIWGPGSKDAYLVETMSPVQDMRFTENMAFIDGDHNGMICGRGGDQVAVPGSKISIPTFINSVKRLNDDDVKAVEAQYKVQLGPRKKDEKGKDGSKD